MSFFFFFLLLLNELTCVIGFCLFVLPYQNNRSELDPTTPTIWVTPVSKEDLGIKDSFSKVKYGPEPLKGHTPLPQSSEKGFLILSLT